MKKIFSFILAISLLLMTACQNNEAENPKESSERSDTSISATEYESNSENPSSAQEKVSESQEESSKSMEQTPKVKDTSKENTPFPSTVPAIKEEKKDWWYEGLKTDKFILPSSSCGDPIPKLYAYVDSAKLSYNNFVNLFSKNENDYFDMSLILESAEEAEDIGERIKPEIGRAHV